MALSDSVFQTSQRSFFAFVDCLIKVDTPSKVKLNHHERVRVLRPRDALLPNIIRHCLNRLRQ